MSAIAVRPPFAYFTDTAGLALDAGYVYVGVANLDPIANPITCYWDEALTIPAPIPIRTTGGYLSRNGSPGVLYTSGTFSIMVKDKNGRLIYSASTIDQDASLRAVSVLDFVGVDPTGSVDSTSGIQAAINASSDVFFPAGDYKTTGVTLATNGRYHGPGRLVYTGAGDHTVFVPKGARNVVIDGLGISYPSAATDWAKGAVLVGEYGTITSGVTIKNCTITGNVWLRTTSNIEILNNTITNGGVYFDQYYADSKVVGNTITNDATFLQNCIGGTYYTDTQSTGMPTYHGNLLVQGNILTASRMCYEHRDITQNGNDWYDTKNIITGNTCKVMSYSGTNPYPFGISQNGAGMVISNNDISFPDSTAPLAYSYGIEMGGSKSIATGNRIAGSHVGVIMNGGSTAPYATQSVISNNIILGVSQGITLFRGVLGASITGNVVEVASTATGSGSDAPCCLFINGETALANGGYADPPMQKISVVGNILRLLPNSYQAISFSSTVGVTIASNVVELLGTTQGICILNDSDATNISNNVFISSSITNRGLGLTGYPGRAIAIVNNQFQGLFIKHIFNYGGDSAYSIQIAGTISTDTTINNDNPQAAFFSTGPTYNRISYNYQAPSKGIWNAGDLVFNRAAGTGWKCTASGTKGTLTGTTATTTSGSPVVTVNTLIGLEADQRITIAGVAGTYGILSIDRTNIKITLDGNAGASVVSAAVAYSAPTFASLPF